MLAQLAAPEDLYLPYAIAKPGRQLAESDSDFAPQQVGVEPLLRAFGFDDALQRAQRGDTAPARHLQINAVLPDAQRQQAGRRFLIRALQRRDAECETYRLELRRFQSLLQLEKMAAGNGHQRGMLFAVGGTKP